MNSNLEYLKIENFRSLVMTENFEACQITILVGRNSAGKSTFARSFPLLRQSVEATKRAPILWFGERVDFGSFEESLRRSTHAIKVPKGEIVFTFGLSLAYDGNSIKFPSHRIGKDKEVKISVRLAMQKLSNASSGASSIDIRGFGYEISITLGSRNSMTQLKVDDTIWVINPDYVTVASYGAILPKISIFRDRSIPGLSDHSPEYSVYSLYSDEINSAIISLRLGALDNFILMTLKNAPLLEKGKLKDHVIQGVTSFGWSELSDYKKRKLSKKIDEIETMVFASKVNTLIDLVNNGLKEYYEGVKYIEPLRAPAIRYYRKQELAIDEIDSKGENLAMFLDNLSPVQLRKFNEWTRKSFGFAAKTKKSIGHVEIVITENGSDDSSNLTDIGFGFSQILPVITQIWLSSGNEVRKKNKSTCIVIEQPELHLHPAFQSKLADVFAAAVSEDKDSSPSFIIETHSNHIINRFGQLISEGSLDNSKVQILIFDKGENGVTKIQNAAFDNEGYLLNWPLGFFEPEV